MIKLITVVLICVGVLLSGGCGTSKLDFGFEYKWGISGTFNDFSEKEPDTEANPKSQSETSD